MTPQGIDGTPAKYPWDEYKTKILLTAQSQDVKLDELSMARSYWTEHLSDENVELQRSGFGSDTNTGVSYHITRPFFNQVYAGAVAVALPFGLILIVIVVLFFKRPKVEVGIKEFLAAYGVVAFTLFLVRPFVVPDKLKTLTRIDYALAAEVTMIIVFTVWYFYHATKDSPNE